MTTATAAAEFQTAELPASDEREPALPLRGDTILGVCEAVGTDLGFNPNFLRIPFAALLLWNPVVIIGSYLALGVAAAASRWFFPVAKRVAAPANEAVAVSEAVEVQEEERLAA